MKHFGVGIVFVCGLFGSASTFGLDDQLADSTKIIEAHDGTKIVFDVLGSGETALVFVHGWGCNRAQWRRQVDAFVDDYTLVVIDLPGHGDSGDDREDWVIENYAKDVRVVADDLGLERMVLVGHSMGGPVVTMAAALMPQRVIGVVPVDALHNVEFAYPDGIAETLVERVREDFDGFMEKFVGGLLAPDVSEQLKSVLIDDSQDNDAEVAAEIFGLFTTIDLEQILSDCPVPVHSINAANFETDIALNRKYNEAFDATIIEDCGHWVMLEQPEAFNEALREVLDTWLEESE